MTVYADTSFLVSLYARDSNSIKAASQMARLPLPIVITPLSELELTNALQLRLYRRQVDSRELNLAHGAYRSDLRERILLLKPMPNALYREAVQLSRRWTAKFGVRTLDLVDIASALGLGADTFASFDLRQRKVADTVGLTLV